MNRYTIMMGTCESQGKVEKMFTISPDLFFKERDKLKAEIKNPNATDESIGKIATDIVNAKVSQKLGEYEDIDESPEHLAKIKQALEIIKKKRVDINVLIVSKNVDEYNKVRFILLKAGSSFWKLTQEEYDLLKEVLL